MTIAIRPFHEPDRPYLQGVYLRCRQQSFHWLEPNELQLADFDSLIVGEQVLVLCLDTVPVGFAGIWQEDSFLHSLFIAPEHKGQGLGRILLAACMPYFRQRATLKCHRQNHGARGFYQHLGWQCLQQVEDHQGGYWLMAAPPATPASAAARPTDRPLPPGAAD